MYSCVSCLSHLLWRVNSCSTFRGIALGLNQLMIPKQGEFTYDTFCFGLGGGVTWVMQGQYTRITTFFWIKPPLSRKVVCDCDVIYVHISINVLFNVLPRVGAYRSVSQRLAAYWIVQAIHTWEAVGSSILHEVVRCISLSKIPGNLVLKTSTWGMREDVLCGAGGLGLHKPSPIADLQIEHLPVDQSQIKHLPIEHFQIEDLQIENLQRTHLQIEDVQFANLQRDGDYSILGFVLSRPLTSVGTCLISFFYGCFLANIWFIPISVLFGPTVGFLSRNIMF